MILYKSVSLADQVFDQLETDILAGKYPRGTLLTEIGLCEELGVSRTPVREALRRLEQEHIIESRGKGMEVLGITDNDAAVMFDVRRQIEGMAAAASARNITEEQIARLRENLELQEFYRNRKDTEKIKSLDSEFHKIIYESAGSVVYYDTLHPLHNKLQKVRKTSLENEARAEQSIQEHQAILRAIAAHDAKKAEEAMARHVSNAQQVFIRRVDREEKEA
ncbi:MAG: GntR family transcriptional regulator [Oscillospiraceae bacterium]|nr:GntR family transcriptional regulator [Oscillospiraceae bacterium]